MIIDKFRNEPDFPFPQYYEEINQFISAQRYWTQVLRSSVGWVENDWTPMQTDPFNSQKQFDGEVLTVEAVRQNKQVIVTTVSYEGEVESYLYYNDGMSAEESEQWGGEPVETPAMTRVEAEQSAREDLPIFKTWVESNTRWAPDPSHPDGGIEIPVERLILTSEISEYAEPKALKALELFLKPGSAKDRVNAAFPPKDDED